MRDDDPGILLGLRRLRVLPRRSRLTGPERTWTVRAVLAWAVLAGLLFMHGAPLSAGCQDGAPTMPATAAVTANLPAAAVTGTVRLTADWMPAMSAAAGARRPAGPPPPASRAAAEERGPCCARLCSSRQPRQGSAGPLAAGPADAVLPSNPAALPARCPSAATRSARPPGRPGLPLPLFLGVSRT
ncbi:MAG: hypothetical protein ACYCU3_21005 [Streptosporangiaceae bacterium]